MIVDTPQASFQLQRFSIPKLTIEEAEAKFNIIDVNFAPSGIYNTSNGEFKLTIGFKAIASNEKPPKEYREVISATIEAYFLIEGKPKYENFPQLFFANSIAIVYPYIRGFISSVTLQAGIRLLLLPILNLSALSDVLKKETTVLS